jgi:hypothetical protein
LRESSTRYQRVHAVFDALWGRGQRDHSSDRFFGGRDGFAHCFAQLRGAASRFFF